VNDHLFFTVSTAVGAVLGYLLDLGMSWKEWAKLSGNKGLTFQGVYSSRTKHVPTAAFDSSFNDPRFKTIDAHGWADLQYRRELPRGWQITGRAYYDNDNYDGFWPVNVSETDEPSVKLFADYGYAKWWGSGIDVEKTLAALALCPMRTMEAARIVGANFRRLSIIEYTFEKGRAARSGTGLHNLGRILI